MSARTTTIRRNPRPSFLTDHKTQLLSARPIPPRSAVLPRIILILSFPPCQPTEAVHVCNISFTRWVRGPLGWGAAVHLQSLRGFSHTQAALCVAVFSLASFCSLPLLRALQRGAHELHDCGAGFGRCLARLQQLPCARMRSAKSGPRQARCTYSEGCGPHAHGSDLRDGEEAHAVRDDGVALAAVGHRERVDRFGRLLGDKTGMNRAIG